MSCFIVPTVEAIVATVARKKVKSNELKLIEKGENTVSENPYKISFSRKLGWLTNMLYGGSALLALEHVWHGEIVPWFPFLTMAGNMADFTAMLQEMATVGVGMAAVVTAAWGVMLLVVKHMEKNADKSAMTNTVGEA